MTSLQIFESPEFGQVRTTTYNGEIAFVAKDVAEKLGYTWSGTSRVEHVPAKWRGVTSVVTPSGTQEMVILTEQGLYFFLARSDKPLAVPYQEWIAGEVIPSIRKTGVYSVAPKPTGMALVQEAMEFLVFENQKLQNKIESDKPKVDFANAFRKKNVLCHFAGLANVLSNNGVDIGRNRLIDVFRKNGDIKQHDALFTQKAIDRGIGQNVPTGSYSYNGDTIVSYRAFLNYKGITEIFDRFNIFPATRDAVLKDLTAADEPLSPEVGGEFPKGYFMESIAG